MAKKLTWEDCKIDGLIYVYVHSHPETGEVVYVGHGTNERAWRCTTLNNQDTANYGHRSKEHAEWCFNLQLDIAKELGVSNMTVWRALNGRNKNSPNG